MARVTDVTLGTVRVIFITRGMKYLAPAIGFVEILIWLLAIGQIMQNLANPICYIAYALGFSTGNFVGIQIAEKLSLGMVLLRIITSKDGKHLIESLNERNYGVTSISGRGAQGDVKIIFTIVPRKEVDQAIKQVKLFDSNAFYSIEEVDEVNKGVFPVKKGNLILEGISNIRPFRKGK